MPRAESHHRALRWAAGVMALALAALVATTATSASRRGATVELLGELERQGRFQNLDYVPKVGGKAGREGGRQAFLRNVWAAVPCRLGGCSLVAAPWWLLPRGRNTLARFRRGGSCQRREGGGPL